MTDTLCFCNPKVTAVVEADLQTVWQIIRQWSTFYFLDGVANETCVIKMYEGGENLIGAVRTCEIGPSLMFERLVAMDEEKYNLKWRTISHPDSVTPFKQASYINALLSLSLREITHNNHTFAEWEVAFYTEQEYAEEMFHTMEHWLIGALRDLQQHVFTPNPTLNQRSQIQTPGPTQPIQPQYAQEHVAKFADLHIDTGVGQQYPVPPVPRQHPERHAGQAPRVGNAIVRQSGKPMGTTSSHMQAPPMHAPPMQQTWDEPPAAPMQQPWDEHSIPPMQDPREEAYPSMMDPRQQEAYMHPAAGSSVQNWASKQQAQHRAHRGPQSHAPKSVASGPQDPAYSDRSESMDSQDLRSYAASQAGSRRGYSSSRHRQPWPEPPNMMPYSGRSQYSAQQYAAQRGVPTDQYRPQYASNGGRYEPSLPQFDEFPPQHDQHQRHRSSRHPRGTR